MDNWVDFRQIKEAVSFDQVVAHYGLTLKAKGRELSGQCPFHKDTKPSFRINLDKKAFHCFGCQAKGNILEFVAAMEQTSLRDAALKLQEWFGVTPPAEGPPARTPKTKGESGKDFEVSQTAITRQFESSSEAPTVNPPLPFTLKGIDATHPYLAERGVSRGLAEYFGVGFFPGKGSMHGRVVIPIHNERGELVAYAGRAIDGADPRYLLPKDFQKGRVLFNLHRVQRDPACQRVVIVEGFFDCIRLVEAGFVNTVALMGTSLSEHQEQLLEPFSEIVLILDADEAGRKATAELVNSLARRHFVRVVDVPTEPDACSIAQLQTLLAF